MSDSLSEEDLIVATITHPAGYIVDLFGILWVRGNEDPNIWSVEWEIDSARPGENTGRNFDNARDAVKFFLAERHQRMLGLEFERLTESDTLYRERIVNTVPEGAGYTIEDIAGASGEILDAYGEDWGVERKVGIPQ